MNDKVLKIGLAGLKPYSGNKGCEALTFSFLYLLKKVLKDYKKVIIYFIIDFPVKSALHFKLKKEYNKAFLAKTFIFNFKYINYKVIKNRLIWFQPVPYMDYVFDFTQGDSFTDLYGYKRFNNWTKVKEYFLNKKYKFIFGSQTIGPFSSTNSLSRAKDVLKKSNMIFVRDEKSFDYVKEIDDDETMKPILTTDVAFLLPFIKVQLNSEKMKVGFNPSGLLWNDTKFLNEGFNYREFCRSFINYLSNCGYEVHLIGHVISKDLRIIDNDYVAMKDLKQSFPNVILSPFFSTPMEAKGYIKEMDVFFGSRMHATIAALSCGVPVIPISYSRKFEGLFNTLGYYYGINGTTIDNLGALDYCKKALDDLDKIKSDVNKCQKLIEKYNDIAITEYGKIIKNN